MGNSWDWTLHLRSEPDAEMAEHLLALASAAGFEPGGQGIPIDRPDEPTADRARLVDELVAGRHDPRLRHRDGAELWLQVIPSRPPVPGNRKAARKDRAPEPAQVRMYSLRDTESVHPEVFERVNELWVESAEASGAFFGEVWDDWLFALLCRDHDLLPDPYRDEAPAPGHMPYPLGHLTYFDADRFARLRQVPDFVPAEVRRTPGGGAVIDIRAALEVPGSNIYAEIHEGLAQLTTGELRGRLHKAVRRARAAGST